MSIDSTVRQEPRLAVQRPVAFFARRRFLWFFTPTALAAVTGAVALLLSGNLLLPFERTTMFEGKMASKSDFFDDAEVRRILMRHNIKVHVTRTGSRDVATHDLESYDFVFPSGQPAADLIYDERNASGKYANRHRPFTSPLVLATYREYAHTLQDIGVATPHSEPGQTDPLYYRLDLTRFLDLVGDRNKTWNSVGIQRHGGSNGNGILAHSPDICTANSAGTYMGLVAYVKNGHALPGNDREADDLAERIKPLVTAQGLAVADLFRTYIAPEGRSVGPIVVIYEHQFLAYQVQQQAQYGKPDRDRVLLYPSPSYLTQPELIALNPAADRLGALVSSNPDLRQRAVELGYRVLPPNSATEHISLASFLHGKNVPVPLDDDVTKASLPPLSLLERMIKIAGGCP